MHKKTIFVFIVCQLQSMALIQYFYNKTSNKIEK